MTRLVPFYASVAALVGLLVACKTDRIVLATVESDQMDAGVMHVRCTTTADCAGIPGTYCERFGCDHTAGKCIPPPTFCPNKEDPSCGDDGVTYFNDCIRRVAGVSCATDGECFDSAATCDANGVGCQSPAVCAQLGQFGDVSSCHPFGGHCWVLPSTCPTDADDGDDRWDECLGDEDDGGAALKCQDSCNAIRSGKAFVRSKVCQ